jgi:hypothetical protein
MFGWFSRDPTKGLRRRYEAKLEEAVQLQRSGDIPAFAIASAEAEELLQQLRQSEAARRGADN